MKIKLSEITRLIQLPSLSIVGRNFSWWCTLQTEREAMTMGSLGGLGIGTGNQQKSLLCDEYKKHTVYQKSMFFLSFCFGKKVNLPIFFLGNLSFNIVLPFSKLNFKLTI